MTPLSARGSQAQADLSLTYNSKLTTPNSKSEPPVGALAARAWGMEGTTLEFNLSRVYSALPGAQVALPRLTEPAPCRS